MTITIRHWLDSGANAQSKREGTITTDELGLTYEEWRAMPYEEQEELIRLYAWDCMDWGFEEVEHDD